jgi:hypothetical protein
MENIKPHVTPKDFFLHIGAMAALYVSAFSLLALLFEYIDVLFPDKLDAFHGEFSGAIRLSIASLIIIFPTYLALTKVLNKDLRENPEKKNIWIRKWLIFLTLFVAGITIIVDLVRLVNEFLGGDITIQFTLKVLAVLIVTGAVFGYYLYDLKGEWEKKVRRAKMIGWITAFIILVSVVSGFFIIGTPASQRLSRFDQEKINDLHTIQWQIVNFWQNKERLPKTLSELEDSISSFIIPIDQQTGEEYGYKIISILSFELCAEFNKESSEEALDARNTRAVKQINSIGPVRFEDINFAHEKGIVCFERTIDPDLYPIRKNQ